MATSFLKRQKEMKRREKQREKAERRAQKKLASHSQESGLPAEGTTTAENDASIESVAVPPEPEPQA